MKRGEGGRGLGPVLELSCAPKRIERQRALAFRSSLPRSDPYHNEFRSSDQQHK
jgi:hypothetical protein